MIEFLGGEESVGMNAIRAVFILALICIPTVTEAMVFGSGATSCVTWSADRQRNEAKSQLSQAWVLGYVTAYVVYKSPNQSMPKPMDSRGMMIWIDNFCDAHPEKDVSDAAKALVEDLTGRAP